MIEEKASGMTVDDFRSVCAVFAVAFLVLMLLRRSGRRYR